MSIVSSIPRSTAELRQAFLTYFNSKNHHTVDTSSLIPANDPTLLFTNAGMVQFKETFLGLETRPYVRATSCQRCVRAGGKHNDLENVGYTARHHTFFEMLGNFSFGDYFKRDAIKYAWEFLTEVLQLPAEKLWITVYKDDQEATDIWLNEINIDAQRFSRCGDKDNFWSMGDIGPCGPCTEIFYDHGEHIVGGPPGSPDEDGDRYIEIWNLVFMQYQRDAQGKMTPLPKPSVDTGMGLERLAAIMQSVHSNYETDLFQNLLIAIAKLANVDNLQHSSLRVIADHIRSCAFLIVDGIVPSNEGRGYVLRRIIRRALRHGHKLGLPTGILFFHNLVDNLDAEMGIAYPELRKSKEIVKRILKQEEERFTETLDHGMRLLEQVIDNTTDKIIAGEVIFKLYDTYGFPTDLTADIAREHNLDIDMLGFEQAMNEQRQRARAASNFNSDFAENANIPNYTTTFTGYENLQDNAEILALFRDGKNIDELKAGENGGIILDQTTFYAESGGQAGDKGLLTDNNNIFAVKDTKKLGKSYIHTGKLTQGNFKIGDKLVTKVDPKLRLATARNHSATHLLHAALRQELGEHVKQKGSLVENERLRFDFSHFEPISSTQLSNIERIVNQQILNNNKVTTKIMALEDAMQSGAMALFGEKYSEDVRVLSISDFSTELCGGTHINTTGDIGLLKIITETGVAAGVRRIEAITGLHSLEYIENIDNNLKYCSTLLKTTPNKIKNRLSQLLNQVHNLEKELSELKSKLASNQGSDLVNEAVEIGNIKVLAKCISNTDVKNLRVTLDQLKQKLKSAVIILATVKNYKISLVAGVTKEQTKIWKAGELVNHVAKQVGGKGGGRPDMAQAGGNKPENLAVALNSVIDWVREKL
jgi:alanyl-tRNA synthetase